MVNIFMKWKIAIQQIMVLKAKVRRHIFRDVVMLYAMIIISLVEIKNVNDHHQIKLL